MHNNPPQVWLITDRKPGHQNQLRGLGARLAARAGAHCHWLETPTVQPSLWRVWRGVDPAPEMPRPNLLIAAGSGTQRTLLAAKQALGCPAVLLMRPNFPYAWLDAAIVPAHDQPPSRPNILMTRGVLNAIQPVQISTSKTGLILVGGPSNHFRWDSADIATQVLSLCRENPDWHWTLSDSRRTPATLLAELSAAALSNLTCVHHADTPVDWLARQMSVSARAWVTPDSVSMVYEALTAGLPTGIFSLTALNNGRVVQGLRALTDAGQLTQFTERASLRAGLPLWEADRAAAWLIDRFKLSQSNVKP